MMMIKWRLMANIAERVMQWLAMDVSRAHARTPAAASQGARPLPLAAPA